MSLTPGARLGPYEIVSAIGAGGMGEVFRARDTKLNRDVAIKVLPAAFADDPERLARFTREAQTLTSLNPTSRPSTATGDDRRPDFALRDRSQDGSLFLGQLSQEIGPRFNKPRRVRQILDPFRAPSRHVSGGSQLRLEQIERSGHSQRNVVER